MRNAVVETLEGDGTLTGLLTAGIYTGVEISRQETPDAFDEFRELLPCALVALDTTAPFGPHVDSANVFVRIHLYQQHGVDVIEQARRRVYALLHRVKLEPAAGEEAGCWNVFHVGDVLDVEDPGLEASMAVSRFQAVVRR